MRTHPFSLALLFLIFPVLAHAGVVNINTANATLLETLSGIGPSKSVAIIEYRTQHGPFVRIEDIQNVSGIGPSTYAGIKSSITVGDTSTPDTTNISNVVSASSTPTSGGSAYTQPPSAPSLEISGSRDVLLEVPTRLSARVTTKGGGVDPALITWSFGDGSSATGILGEKTYHYAGTYLVTAGITDGLVQVQDEIIVTAKPAKVRLLSISNIGITIMNDSKERLDLSHWRLVSDTGTFRIPEGTMILPEASVLFPFAITNLPIAFDAMLLYPNGVIAARYIRPELSTTTATSSAHSPSEQPSLPTDSYKQVQKVETISSTRTNVQLHDEAVSAPAAATELAAAGAAFPPPVVTSDASSLLRSPWMLGLLGIMTLAGGAFVLL